MMKKRSKGQSGREEAQRILHRRSWMERRGKMDFRCGESDAFKRRFLGEDLVGITSRVASFLQSEPKCLRLFWRASKGYSRGTRLKVGSAAHSATRSTTFHPISHKKLLYHLTILPHLRVLLQDSRSIQNSTPFCGGGKEKERLKRFNRNHLNEFIKRLASL